MSQVEVNEALVRKVADLARLALTDHEVTLYAGQMKTTLGYVELISQVKIPEGTEPLYNPLADELSNPSAVGTPMREDQIEPSPTTADGKPKMIKPAPDTLYEGFKVPPIL